MSGAQIPSIPVLSGELPPTGGLVSVCFTGDPYATLMWIQKPKENKNDATSMKTKNKHKTAKKWLKQKKTHSKNVIDEAKSTSREETHVVPCGHTRVHVIEGPRDNGEQVRFCCDCGACL